MTRVYIRITTPTLVTYPTKSFTNVSFCEWNRLAEWKTHSCSLFFCEHSRNLEKILNLMKIAMGSNRYWYGLFIVFNTFNTVPFPNYQIFTLIYFDLLIDACINEWTIQFLKTCVQMSIILNYMYFHQIFQFIIELEKVAV